MVVDRTKFFLILAVLFVIPMIVPRVLWLLHSQRTEGIMAFEGLGNAGDQIKLSYSVIYFKCGKDTIWFNGLGNLRLSRGERVPVRYQTGDPSDAKVDIFAGIWGDILVYGGTLVLILLITFLHPEVVPRRSKVRLTYKRPFIKIV